jgi:hypothetical protein
MRLRFGIVLILLFSGCGLFYTNDEGPLEMSFVSQDSVYDVFGSFQVSFNKKIVAESLCFRFDPPFFLYHTVLVPAADTVTVFLDDDLAYSTQYTLLGNSTLRSENGDTVSNSLLYQTINGEMEPNDDALNADTIMLNRQYGGKIEPWTDVDYCCIGIASANDSVRVLLDHQTGDFDFVFLDKDHSGSIAVSANVLPAQDTVTVLLPDTGCYFIKVSAKPSAKKPGRYRIAVLQ